MENDTREGFEGGIVAEKTTYPLSFHGSGGTLFGIQIVNLLLIIVTLGIYYFWAKARVRGYVWGQAAFDGDRFSYHGTGKETCLGWLKAAVVFGLPFILLQNAPKFTGLPIAIQAIGGILSFVLIAVFIPFAMVGSRRYRLSRSSLLGIRFSFRGRWRDYAKIFYSGWGLTVITLGLYAPYFDMRSSAYITSQSHFGNKPFGFDGRGGDLFKKFFLSRILAIFTLGISLLWYSVIKTKYIWDHTTFESARFHSSITFGGIAKLYLVNGLLLICTLGFAAPWVKCRTLGYYLERLTLDGRLDMAAIAQDAMEATAFGEEIGDFLDMDFDLG